MAEQKMRGNSTISIHTLRVEGDCNTVSCISFCGISIHTLRVEGDIHQRKSSRRYCSISIHTLRVEGDP